MPELSDPATSQVDTKPRPDKPTAPRRDREFTVKERTQWQMALRRFLKHRVAVVSAVIFVLLVLFGS